MTTTTLTPAREQRIRELQAVYEAAYFRMALQWIGQNATSDAAAFALHALSKGEIDGAAFAREQVLR
jgi:hypothetical protein